MKTVLVITGTLFILGLIPTVFHIAKAIKEKDENKWNRNTTIILLLVALSYFVIIDVCIFCLINAVQKMA